MQSTTINTINLVCFASNNFRESIVSSLLKLGIVALSVDAQCWLNKRVEANNLLTVLVLPEKKLFDFGAVNTILANQNSRYFVIFPSPLTEQAISILKVCRDCCHWPCDPLELVFRLNRLLLRSSIPLDLLTIDMEHAAWRNLNLIGQSPLFLNTLSFIKKSSDCSAPVLIEGETGCGKEVAARAIHYLGCRKNFPFIPINCGAIPDHLFENELFGHEKGAYTDAKKSHAGLVQQASGGTVFLDEIEVLSAKGQVTLLRLIEDNMIRPLGAAQSRKVDIRIIAASNVSLSGWLPKACFVRTCYSD